ncbi:thioredoxin 1 [Diaminobutyricimonas aerilata]|uniref:Thioredoxin n=1 Tax=Diaminobutyricimonas aerilata TaxID=1162967 RepID=A0A2M9CMH1_9MICO|nr:thioredoxin domain-containing protein [Diaminobutyricimonas aerilata]PJJ73101.1 thioredoxin 1 [Diaminobutyricimonas aerilata]
MSALPEVTDATFRTEVLDADDTVLVKSWADWCPPCRALDPILDTLAAEQHPGLRIVGINADDNPRIAAEYRVLGLPTMKVFQGGEVVKTVLGAKPAPALRAEFADYLR